MNGNAIALILGLFAAPAWLAWFGHHLRTRTHAARATFWGGVMGHTIATVVLVVLVLAPPELWASRSTRETAVYWILLAGALVGAAVGRIVGSRSTTP